MSATKPTLEKVVTDPEDDLDELDDLLPEFTGANASLLSPSSPAPPPPSAATTTFGRPRTNTRVDAPPTSIPGSGSNLDPTVEVDEDALSSDFAKELAQGMESLMREIAGEAAGSTSDKDVTEEERNRVFKAAWEAMLVDGMDGNLGDGGLEGIGAALGKSEEKEQGASGFQDKIKQAMDKLKESESKAQGSAGASGAGANNPESIEALLKSLGDLGLGEGGEDEAELAGFLETMMGQLMSKEVLYEPLKELANGFPSYLEKPPSPLSVEDRTRYENQLVCVRKIIAVFDREGYSDSNTEHNKEIVDLMSEMQSFGTPPAEIMGPMPPGLDGSIPGLGEEGCTIA
ncbi:hypothetical protein M413DRAFT_447771 [Hebeloma cylindrosporum]|uniref:Pex19-domain-containing protein n=1 Tax=Hebeloma cylindrosporum TaxID=76867 RepID=A0A0C3C4L4_HEBCY|nr:hypothetical protein M413DRAFT_447771 [Hebeloma cylindrosporum h7]